MTKTEEQEDKLRLMQPKFLCPVSVTTSALPPKPPSAAAMLRRTGPVINWQLNMAMYLHRMGCRGPFEVGDSLCIIDKATENITVIARRKREWEGAPAVWRYHRGLPAGVKEMEDVMGRPRGSFAGSLLKFDTGEGMPVAWIPKAESSRRREARWPLKGEDPMWWRAPRMRRVRVRVAK